MYDQDRKARRISADDRSAARFLARVLPGAEPGPIPGFIPPCLPTLQKTPRSGAAWVHEIAYEGYRLQAHLERGRPTLFDRDGDDRTRRLTSVAAALKRLPVNRIVLDGEVIVQDEVGRSDLPALEADLAEGRQDRLVYLAFDLLHLDGFDIREAPFVDRKRVLAALLAEAGEGPIAYGAHLEIDGDTMLERARQMGLAGIVSKRLDAPYRSGRQRSWLTTPSAAPDR